jgi:hypothetical protein
VSIVAIYQKKNSANFAMPMQGRYVNDITDEKLKTYSSSNVDLRQINHHYSHLKKV